MSRILFLYALLLALPSIIVAIAGGRPQATLGGDLNLLGSSFGVPGRNATFTHVIVGAGTAGLVVATRLAQNASNSVAVIEAGGFYEVDNGNLSVIPAFATFDSGASPTDSNPLIDWGFVTTPQAGLDGRKLHYARGKCLGGRQVSARNYMTYQRGTNDSYARWASQVGDDTYQFNDFLPYFKKSVHFTPPDNEIRALNASVSFSPDAFSSDGSPLQVSIPVWANPFSSLAKAGLNKLGVGDVVDFVSGALLGVQYTMNTIDPRDQTRSSSESSFLRVALDNTTLQVYKSTLAKRIIFDGKRASGVQVNTAGLEYTLSATQEVIMSAGVFQSPQILMVSGVGPANTLQQYNIPVVSALEGVGQNMWDHVLFGPTYQVDVTTHSALGNAAFRAIATEQYLANGTGMLGNGGGDLLGWEKYPSPQRNALTNATRAALATFPPDWPELEYLFLDGYGGDHENYATGAPNTPFMYASSTVGLISPLSRGNVTISSADAADPPVINPNWLTHPADQELALAAFKRVRALMGTDVLSAIVTSEVYPGLNVSSDAQILESIRQSATTIFHAAATCKMGTANDTMAVLDSRARVFGTEGLRVVDISAFPLLPPGHPQATVYALAEKIADDIMTGR